MSGGDNFTSAEVATSQLQIVNQWTDDSGYTWRKMVLAHTTIGMVLGGLSTVGI